MVLGQVVPANPVCLTLSAEVKPYTLCNAANFPPVSFSTSACRLLPCASIVTIAAKSRTRRCHIASGIPNSISSTPSTFYYKSLDPQRAAPTFLVAAGVSAERILLMSNRTIMARSCRPLWPFDL